MIPRVLEPEAMETAEEVRQYDAMDHSAVNSRFVADFLAAHGPCRGGEILDVGTGTARIPIALAQADRQARILALDLSETMLAQAAINIAAAGLVAPDPVPPGRRQVAAGRCSARRLRRGHLQHDHPPHPRPRARARDDGPPGRAGRNAHGQGPGASRVADEITRLADTYAGGESPRSPGALRGFAPRRLDPGGNSRDSISRLGLPPVDDVTMTSDRHWTWTWRSPG